MKIRVGVFFGGASVEHEVSIISASQTINALDKKKYKIVPVYITKDKEMYTGKRLLNIKYFKNIDKLLKKITRVQLVKIKDEFVLKSLSPFKKSEKIDIAFPVVHGNGEDGTLQGFFEMIGVPFTGCDVKGAVVGQDKIYMKMLFKENKIPTTNFISFVSSDYETNEEKVIERTKSLRYPLFVKPSSLGSSVGISRVNNKKELIDAIEEAIQYDKRIIIEEGVSNLVEVNCSVLGDYENQRTSDIEEVMGNDEFLSFKDKYLSGGSSKNGSKSGMASTNRIIPARIDSSLIEEVEETAKKVFKLLDTSGVCRIDFLIDKVKKQVYVNEINTIPGSLAFYLWESININFEELVNEIVEISIKREREKEKLIFTYDSNILNNFNGAKASKLK